MSIHDGHRDRLKKRFLNDGLDSFTEIQVLELLLFYAIPRRDTNLLAHNLLDRFGTLHQVLDAPIKELVKVPGIGENAALLLHLAKDMGRYYQVSQAMNVRQLSTLEDCGKFMIPHFFGRSNETVFLLCLDGGCKVLSCKEIGEGSVNSAGVPIRRVVEMALNEKASSVMLAHNHPSGIALPSSEDISTTRRLALALHSVGIVLIDHIIVADGDYVSIAQSGYNFRDFPEY